MPVAGGPFIQKTGILLEVDAANAASYPGTGTTWTNLFRPGTYNGTINGTVGFNSTDAYGALTFPGTGSTYVDFGNIGDLSVSWSFQVAVKPAPSASGNYTILSYSSGSGTGSLTFELDYSSSTQTAVLLAYSATGSTQVVYRLTGSVSTGSWSIINASYGGTVLGMFVNGRPTDYALTTGSTVGYNANNRLYFGGTFGTTSSFYTGSAASLLTYNADVPNTRIIQNYNAFATRFGLPPSNLFVYATDPDAFRFIEVANITSSVQVTAVNNLVVGLKSANLWNKMQAIYPFVGGTGFSHKWNLKDPRDLDDAFRIQYIGAITHTATGVQTAGGYMNTYWNPSDALSPTESIHIGVNNYTTSSVGSIHNNEFGNNFQTDIYLSPTYGSSAASTYFALKNTSNGILGNNSGQGYFILSRLDTTKSTGYIYRSNTLYNSGDNTNTYTTANNGQVLILNDLGYQPYYGVINFFTIGSGLTAAETATLYSIMQSYQTILGRNV
jgi:hypothetical protein